MADYRDFKEIAHCGGKMSFNVACDDEGRLSISMGWTYDRPKPAAIAGLYADLSSGAVIADFRLSASVRHSSLSHLPVHFR
jgi:hypothetical protein